MDLRLSQDDIDSALTTTIPLVPIPEEEHESASASTSTHESDDETAEETDNETGTTVSQITVKDAGPKRWDTPEIHNEVEDILCSAEDRRTLFELFASDPRYYIELINNYKKTKDGSDIFLPDLLNIKTSRIKNGKFIIKFKFNDDDRWEEVGYDSNAYSDDDTYKAFSEKVKILLMRPKNQRDHLRTELTDVSVPKKPVAEETQTKQPPKELPIPPSQGKQSKISKIDRFRETVAGLPRYVDDTKAAGQQFPFMSSSMAAQMRQPTQPQQSRQKSAPQQELVKKRIVRKQEPISDDEDESECDEYVTDNDTASVSTSTTGSAPTINSIVDGYKRNLLKQMKQVVPALLLSTKQPTTNSKLLKELWNLRKKCPTAHKHKYDQMLKQLQHVNIDPFVSKVLSTIPYATVSELPYLYNFVASSSVAGGKLTHEQICNALQLDEDDRELLRDYDINLARLWEHHQ